MTLEDGTYTPDGQRVTFDFGYWASHYGLGLVTADSDEEVRSAFSAVAAKAGWVNGYVGIWRNNGSCYVDVSLHFESLDDAVDFGIRNKQYALWDCRENCEIPIACDAWVTEE